MSTDNDILQNPALRRNPFTAPRGYAMSLEERLHGRITSEETPSPATTLWSKAKAPVMLALTFAVIFGMGYGVLSLTGTAGVKSEQAPAGMAEVLESWSLPSTFIEGYYDEMDSHALLEHSITTLKMTDELESEIMNCITMNDIMYYPE